jgi:hypothetical protein
MAVLRAEFEQKFTEVLTSKAVTALRVATGALDPHPSRRPEQGDRSPPRGRQRHLSPDTERLPRRPGVLRRQLEPHHTAQPSRRTKPAGRRTKPAGRRTGNGPGQPRAGAIRRGEDNASAIVRGSYRSVCHRCSPGSPGVDPEPLEQFSAENTARLAPSPGPLYHGPARSQGSTSRFIPLPALCRPPTSRWRAGAHVDVGRPHRGWTSQYGGILRRRASPCGSVVWCRSVPHLPPLSAPQQGNHS